MLLNKFLKFKKVNRKQCSNNTNNRKIPHYKLSERGNNER